MSLPLLVAFFAVLSFGIVSIYLSSRLQKTRRKLEILEWENKQRAFEENQLEEIHEAIDATLDLKKITGVLMNHLDSIFDCTTVSSLIVEENKLLLTTKALKPIPHSYTEEVKDAMISSLETLEKQDHQETAIKEEVTGTIQNELPKQPIGTLINLPLMIHHSVAAIITITSTQNEAFPHQAVASMQHVLKQTSRSISRLDNILQVEKGRLTAMIESMPDGIFMIDPDNKLLLINPAARQFLSLHKEQLTTMDVLSALPVSVDFKEKIAVALQHNQGLDLGELVMKNKMLSFSIRPVHGPADQLLGVSVLIHDATLKHSVPRMKEDFTNIIVHELRSPLTSIKASSELLISPTEFSKDEQAKLIHLIYSQSNKLLTEVEQILDAAKLEAGVFIVHKQQGDLKQLIKEVCTIFQPEAEQKLVNFIVDVDPNLPPFSFDAKQLNQALSNVLSNSMKFTSSGGTIQVLAKQKHNDVIITIADTGAGIPKDKQHLIFHKFGQLSEASARVGKGLGLYLAKGIIEAHGGKVQLDSDTGRGTTIFLTLPLTGASYHKVSIASGVSDTQKMVN